MLGGFNKTFVQVLSGASAEDAHGGTGAGMYADQGVGYRLINWGDEHFTQNLGFAHLINVGYSTGMKGYDNKRSFSVVARPYYQLTKMTRILAEAGYYNERTKGNDGDSASTNARKFTLAYAITPDASNFWSRPEIRFYVSNVHVSETLKISGGTEGDYRKQKDTMFGVQVEAWW